MSEKIQKTTVNAAGTAQVVLVSEITEVKQVNLKNSAVFAEKKGVAA